MVRHRLTSALIGLAAASVAVTPAAQDQTTFRGGTDLVTVDVAVEQNHRPVAGLTSADFIVTDNGVAQQIEALSTEALPANVTLLVDVSGEMEDSLGVLRRDLIEAAALLRPADRLRLLSFGAEVTLVSPMQAPGVALPVDRLTTGGRPLLADALALSLFRKRPPDRGELVVAFTAGIDRGSSIGVERLRRVARTTEAVLHVVVMDQPRRARFCFDHPAACLDKELRRLAESTGGQLVKQPIGRRLPEGLAAALDGFHQSYTLRYTRRGVARAGWHDITVTIARKGKFIVRARRGYVAA
jgi:VWFA-related protein